MVGKGGGIRLSEDAFFVQIVFKQSILLGNMLHPSYPKTMKVVIGDA